MIHLFLVRHGETDWNVNRRFQGSSDQPLNATGEVQARQLAYSLREHAFDHIFASDLSRVMHTARIALPDDLSITPEPRLREISFGKFEGLTWDEIQATYPDEFTLWQQDRRQNPHGGETLDMVVARVHSFVNDLRAAHDDARIAAFAHGGTIGILLSLLLGTPPDKWWQFRIDNTAVSEIAIYESGSVLLRFNDTYHLTD